MRELRNPSLHRSTIAVVKKSAGNLRSAGIEVCRLPLPKNVVQRIDGVQKRVHTHYLHFYEPSSKPDERQWIVWR